MTITYENNLDAFVEYDVTSILPNIPPADTNEFRRFMRSWETMVGVLSDQATEMGEYQEAVQDIEDAVPYDGHITYHLWKVEFEIGTKDYSWYYHSACDPNYEAARNYLDTYTYVGSFTAHVVANI